MKKSNSNALPYEIQVAAYNLSVPWALDISDEGTLYFTERSGNIKRIEEENSEPQTIFLFTEPFIATGEGGLMGLALDPEFSQNHYIYVMHTYMEDDNQISNRVVRLIVQDGEAFIDKILIDKIPGGQIHNGGRIKIGPDQKLYITTGDAGDSVLAQDINSFAGKILRIELDGGIPEDNPFEASPVYSWGHRNPQGLAWNTNNILYASEHGPMGHDEINIIVTGGNYGWPLAQRYEEPSDMVVQRPLIHSGVDTWAPSGIAFIEDGPWQNELLVTNLRGNQLLAMSLNEDGTQITDNQPWFQNTFGRLRDVIQDTDGTIYFSTSNLDGRGNPGAGDDRIIRLRPMA
ncbi:PQQ-dependent sugar dehydrogenase [Aminipila sp.]|uniref:PQQ-dependent sugar dehydrogenase n=1 Tax=Aminipila sp. TaxID=2060095 RepID=UPI0028971262|nr:PQQ-dependent sugar dehydrogenase [Aminipila sp.]